MSGQRGVGGSKNLIFVFHLSCVPLIWVVPSTSDVLSASQDLEQEDSEDKHEQRRRATSSSFFWHVHKCHYSHMTVIAPSEIVTNSRVGRVSTHPSLFETLEQVDHAVGNYLKYSIRGGSKRAKVATNYIRY
jgi:hypothetical protein